MVRTTLRLPIAPAGLALALSAPALLSAMDPCALIGLGLYSQGSALPRALFLGEVNQDAADPASVLNLSGRYGSTDAGNGIYNLFGAYGSPESNFSASNPSATLPPRAWRYAEETGTWTLVARVTAAAGPSDTGAVHPDSLRHALEAKRCVEAPRVAVKPDVRLDSFTVKGPPYSVELRMFVVNHSNTDIPDGGFRLRIYVDDSVRFDEPMRYLGRWERGGLGFGFRPKSDTVRLRLVIDEEGVLDEAEEGNNVLEALLVQGVLSARRRPGSRAGAPGVAQGGYSADGKRVGPRPSSLRIFPGAR